MKISKFSACEIRVVANGYQLGPAFDYSRGQSVPNWNDLRVFESFENLVAWLQANLEQPAEGRAP